LWACLQGLDGVIEKHSAILSRNASWSKTQRISRLPKYLAVQYMRFYWKPTPNSRDREGVNCKMMRVRLGAPSAFYLPFVLTCAWLGAVWVCVSLLPSLWTTWTCTCRSSPTAAWPEPFRRVRASPLRVACGFRYDFCSENLKKKLKVYRDKYAEEALATKEGKSADESKAGADEAKASDATPAAAAADVDMGDDEDDDDLAAALAMSLEGDTKMVRDRVAVFVLCRSCLLACSPLHTHRCMSCQEEDASDDSLLGPGIPKEFRGMYAVGCFGTASRWDSPCPLCVF